VLEGPLAARLLPDETARHALHGGANLLGVLCAVSGFMIAFTYHQVGGKDHTALTGEVGTHRTWTRPAHVITGYAVLLGLLAQSTAGLCKFVARSGGGGGALLRAAHARAGPVLWLAGLACIALAAYFEYLEVPPQDKPHWSGAQLAAVLALLAALAAAVLGLLGAGSRAHAAADAEDDEGGRGARAGLLQ